MITDKEKINFELNILPFLHQFFFLFKIRLPVLKKRGEKTEYFYEKMTKNCQREFLPHN